jgi:filamentous hemagglutinin
VYTNRFPEDTPAIRAGFRLEERAGKWVTVAPDGTTRTATGRYLFVTMGGLVFVCRQRRHEVALSHCDLSGGDPVDYAGEIQFSGRSNRGQVRWWDNQSGHYEPQPVDANKATLPLDFFRPWRKDRL